MAKRKKRRIDECVYCGQTAELTRDHVIPVALFTQPYPPNLITVRACATCNNINKSNSDTLLRDILATDYLGSQHPVSQDIFNEKVVKAHQRNQSWFTKTVAAKARLQPLHTHAGVYLGDYAIANVGISEVTTIFRFMVRGLYYDHQKKRIPNNYTFEVTRYDPWDFKIMLRQVQQDLNLNGPRLLGDVFGCAYALGAEDPFTTWWFLWFYNAVCYTVWTAKAHNSQQ